MTKHSWKAKAKTRDKARKFAKNRAARRRAKQQDPVQQAAWRTKNQGVKATQQAQRKQKAAQRRAMLKKRS